MGTMPYMSPEQVRAQDLDARTRICSRSGWCSMKWLPVPPLPFRGESSGVIFDFILNRAPVPPARPESRLASWVWKHIIDKCVWRKNGISATSTHRGNPRRFREAEAGRGETAPAGARGGKARSRSACSRAVGDPARGGSVGLGAYGYLVHRARSSPTRTYNRSRRLREQNRRSRIRRHPAPGDFPWSLNNRHSWS